MSKVCAQQHDGHAVSSQTKEPLFTLCPRSLLRISNTTTITTSIIHLSTASEEEVLGTPFTPLLSSEVLIISFSAENLCTAPKTTILKKGDQCALTLTLSPELTLSLLLSLLFEFACTNKHFGMYPVNKHFLKCKSSSLPLLITVLNSALVTYCTAKLASSVLV